MGGLILFFKRLIVGVITRLQRLQDFFSFFFFFKISGKRSLCTLVISNVLCHMSRVSSFMEV